MRFYFSSRLNSSATDIDLNFEDYKSRINSDLIGKFINIGSRCSSFIEKNLRGELSQNIIDEKLIRKIKNASNQIEELYESREYAKLIRLIASLCDDVNCFIDENKPWLLAKEADKSAELHQVVSLGLFAFRMLAIYLKPIIPDISGKIA